MVSSVGEDLGTDGQCIEATMIIMRGCQVQRDRDRTVVARTERVDSVSSNQSIEPTSSLHDGEESDIAACIASTGTHQGTSRRIQGH
jgi:hypothetical protein